MLVAPVDVTTLQRARGRAGVAFGQGGRVRDLFQQGSAKCMLPRTHGPEPHAVFVNTAGGLTGGDRLALEVTLAAGAQATATTQTAERIYRSAGGTARVEMRLSAGPGARLCWLPQETILFEGAALDRRLEADLEGDATLLLCEAVILGRAAMGEDPQRLFVRDRWRIRRDGRLVHAEALRLDPPLAAHRTQAGLGAARAFATIAMIGPDAEDRLGALCAQPLPPGVRGGASAWDGRLVIRFLADDPAALRRAMIDRLARLRGTPLPRVWTM